MKKTHQSITAKTGTMFIMAFLSLSLAANVSAQPKKAKTLPLDSKSRAAAEAKEGSSSSRLPLKRSNSAPELGKQAPMRKGMERALSGKTVESRGSGLPSKQKSASSTSSSGGDPIYSKVPNLNNEAPVYDKVAPAASSSSSQVYDKVPTSSSSASSAGEYGKVVDPKYSRGGMNNTMAGKSATPNKRSASLPSKTKDSDKDKEKDKKDKPQE